MHNATSLVDTDNFSSAAIRRGDSEQLSSVRSMRKTTMSRVLAPRFKLAFICALFVFETVIATNNVDIPQLIIQNTLQELNNLAPTPNHYKSANVVGGYVLNQQPDLKYRITVNLERNCDGNIQVCPQETCVIDVHQRSEAFTFQSSTIQCSPTSQQNKNSLRDQISDQMMEELEKQIVDPQIHMIEEMQMMSDMIDKPFVAVRPDPQYCPGCPFELKPNVPGLWELGEEIAKEMDQLNKSDFKYKVIQIVQVFRSVPPNMNVVRYDLLMEIANSTCLKTSLIDRSECSVQPNIASKLCKVVVDEKPWLTENKHKIVKNNCTETTNTLNELNVNNFEESSSVQEDTIYNRPETYEYDQVAQEGKLSQSVSENESAQEKLANKYKLFNEFLKDFDVPIRETSTTPDSREPVIEEYVKKEIIPETVRAKRQLSILPTPEKIFLRKLAQIVVDILDGMDEDNDKRLVLDVIDARKETEDESVYHFTVKVINTKCTEKEALDRKCMAELVGPTNICNMEVEVNRIRPLGPPKIRNSSCVEEDHQAPPSRSKRQLLGGFQSADPNNEDIKKYAAVAVSEYNTKEHQGPNQLILMEITEATTQVVNGRNYLFKAKLGESTCPKGTTGNCVLKQGAEPMLCQLKLHVPINQENPTLIRSTCGEKSRRKRGLVGGKKPIDVNDPKVQEYAALGISKYTELYGGESQPVLTEVVDAKSQVVSGVLYEITLRIGESNCTKGTTDNCHPRDDSETKTCVTTVWVRPWLGDDATEVKVDCKQKTRRSLRGQNYSQKMKIAGQRYAEEGLFKNFKKEYNKQYSSAEEEERRFEIFRANLETMRELQRTEQGTGQYGITQFADLSYEEFKKNHLGLNPKKLQENSLPLPKAEIPDIELPTEFDWRHYNVVTEVKDQGSCGSCWAFSVTGNIESLYALKHGKLLSLSEQELVDCDKLDDGCNGGMPNTAYEAIEQLGGLETEDAYPYDGHDEKCHFKQNLAKVQITSGLNITSNETQMAQWLVTNGPITIGINANAMQFYVGGVSHPFKFLCNPKNLDHGVLIVGFGIKKYPIFKKTLPYWLIKNSWGPNWGEQGYYRVYRGDGTCGVNQMPTSAVVA